MNAIHLPRLRQTALSLCLLAASARAAPVELRQTSVPVGIVNTTTTPESGSTVVTQTAPESSSSFRFVEWTLNGVRHADPSGAAANPCTFVITTATDAVAIYLPETEDADADGLQDWWERRYFGSLQYTAGDSPDSDAFPNSNEFVRLQHPGLHNLHEQGGVSRRRSQMMPIIGDWNVYGLIRKTASLLERCSRNGSWQKARRCI